MSEAKRIFTASRVLSTPISNLLRGKITGPRPKPVSLLANLPEPAAALIKRVVRRTRLSKAERAAVEQELAAHFIDGLATGEPAESLIQCFGDERQAARLIRRAKIRQRSWISRAFTWISRGIAAMLAIYLLAGLWLAFGQPSPRVDYTAELNRPLLGVPDQDRGWPLYRQVILAMQVDGQTDKVGGTTIVKLPDWIGRRVDGKSWPAMESWLRANAGVVETLRQATTKPAFGFVIGPNGSINDPQIFLDTATPAPNGGTPGALLTQKIDNHLNYVRSLAYVLQADTRLAAIDRDGDRALRDINAILDLSRQLHAARQSLISELVAMGINALGLNTIDQSISTDPTTFSDVQFIGLAHRIATPATASDLLSLDGDRMYFLDAVQRIYTDDGHGNGYLVTDAVQNVGVNSLDDKTLRRNFGARLAFGPAAACLLPSRKEVVDLYTREMDQHEADLHQPRRMVDSSREDPVKQMIGSSKFNQLRYVMLSLLLPSYDRSGFSAERELGQRDGLLVGIALEVYRRHHGHYPADLNQLTPLYLPQIPADRITGEPVKYRLIDGKPLVYSVGADRVDDGGVAGKDVRGQLSPSITADWGSTPEHAIKGDWILYPQPRQPVADDDEDD